MTAKLGEIDKNSKSEYHEMKGEFKRKSKLFYENNNKHRSEMVWDKKKKNIKNNIARLS